MSLLLPPTTDELRRALADVRAHPERKALCAFALEHLSSQAEGRSLLALGPLVDKRAEAHGVDRDAAQTELGNLLAIAQELPKNGTELALLSAYAVAGLDATLAGLEPAARGERVERFIAHGTWLEMATSYRVSVLAEELLRPEHLGLLHERTALLVIRGDDGRDDEASRRARGALRIGWLSVSKASTANEALITLSSQLRDPMLRGLSDIGRGELPTSAPPMDPRIEGRVSAYPRAAWVNIVRMLTGWALMRWVLRVVGWTLGVRRPMWIEVDASVITVQRRITFLGKTIRERREVVRLSEVQGARRHARFQSLHLLTGMTSLGVGVIVGCVVAADALRVHDQRLLTIAAAIASIGAGLDLMFEVIIPGRARAVTVDVMLKNRDVLRISGISLDEADGWLRALGTRLHLT